MLNNKVLILCAAIALANIAVSQNAPTKKRVQFKAGTTQASVRGSLVGYDTIDYLVRSGAGQSLTVSMRASNAGAYFNVIAPGQKDAAMFMGEMNSNRMEHRVLPTEGDYVVRVFLVRAAARRKEKSNFTLSIGLAKRALPNGGAAGDVKIPGTPFHASTDVPATYYLEPSIKSAKAYVQRRGTDGTATVEVRSGVFKRRILFVKGKPVASDSTDKFTVERKGDVTIIKFGNPLSERFDIPDILVFGG